MLLLQRMLNPLIRMATNDSSNNPENVEYYFTTSRNIPIMIADDYIRYVDRSKIFRKVWKGGLVNVNEVSRTKPRRITKNQTIILDLIERF